ncbi:hypothetical protein Ancab_039175 [Ancistrocladus abbreviatus]
MKNQMSYADAVRGRSSTKERASDLVGEKNLKHNKAMTWIVLSSKEEDWAWLCNCLYGSAGSANGGKQWSKSGEFVVGDGGNKCSIYEVGQEFCLAELKDLQSGPNSTRCKAR